METLEYTTTDKSSWGDGPWMTEPDKKQWPDPATGLPCLIVRQNMGALCGYVGVPEGHALFGKEYDDVDADLRCHGGVTFTGACRPDATEEEGICHTPGAGESDRVWWLGFDAAHCNDFIPRADADMRKLGIPSMAGDSVYRDLAYMTANCTELAAQLRAMA